MSQPYDLLITSSDALPPSYRRLVGAKAIKLDHVKNMQYKCSYYKDLTVDTWYM